MLSEKQMKLLYAVGRTFRVKPSGTSTSQVFNLIMDLGGLDPVAALELLATADMVGILRVDETDGKVYPGKDIEQFFANEDPHKMLVEDILGQLVAASIRIYKLANFGLGADVAKEKLAKRFNTTPEVVQESIDLGLEMQLIEWDNFPNKPGLKPTTMVLEAEKHGGPIRIYRDSGSNQQDAFGA